MGKKAETKKIVPKLQSKWHLKSFIQFVYSFLLSIYVTVGEATVCITAHCMHANTSCIENIIRDYQQFCWVYAMSNLPSFSHACAFVLISLQFSIFFKPKIQALHYACIHFFPSFTFLRKNPIWVQYERSAGISFLLEEVATFERLQWNFGEPSVMHSIQL